MSEFNITVEGGSSVRLPTAGKYVDRDIIVTAEGGSEDLDSVLTEQEELIAELQDVLKGKTSGGTANPVIEAISVTENGTYTAPDGVDGYSPVEVNVPIPDGYIVPSGELKISENGTHDVTEYASVTVDVEESVGQTIYYTRAGACYVPNMIIEPNDGVYNASSLNARYQYATYLETVEIPNIVLSSSVPSVFAFCSSLRTAKVAKVTNYGHYWFRNCTALETVQLGSLGYPVTNMTTLVFSGDTQINLTITIYVDATTLAELPTNITGSAPFGATKATIVYRNSTTGEVITE